MASMTKPTCWCMARALMTTYHVETDLKPITLHTLSIDSIHLILDNEIFAHCICILVESSLSSLPACAQLDACSNNNLTTNSRSVLDWMKPTEWSGEKFAVLYMPLSMEPRLWVPTCTVD